MQKFPTVGYVVSLFNYLKFYCEKNSISMINLEIIQQIPSDLENIWLNYYKKLDINSKRILHSVRLIFEFKLKLDLTLLRIIYSKYYNGKKLIFNDRLLNLIDYGWLRKDKTDLFIWEAQIESIPLEMKKNTEITFCVDLIDFINTNLVKTNKEFSCKWINGIAQKIFLASRTFDEIEKSREIYVYANELKENPWSYFGIGLCYLTHFQKQKSSKLIQNSDLIELAIDYFKKSIKLNPNSFETSNNLGSCYHKLANISTINERRTLIKEALKYYDKSITLSPNYPISYLNKAYFLFDNTVIDTQLGIINDWETLESKSNAILNLTERSRVLLPFVKEINAKEATKIESYIYELEGRIYSSKGKPNKEKSFFIKAIEKYRRALDLNPDLIAVYIGLARNKYYMSFSTNFKDKKSLIEALDYLNNFVKLEGEETTITYLLRLKCLHAEVVGKSEKIALERILSIDKELKKIYKNKPIFIRDSEILEFWMQLRQEIVSNCSNLKIREKYFLKYLDTALLYLSFYPYPKDIKEFESKTNELLAKISKSIIRKKAIKKMKMFIRKNKDENLTENLHQIIFNII